LREVIRLAQIANDLKTLVCFHNLVGYIFLIRREFLSSITEFKASRDIAEEEEDDEARLFAYGLLGSTYQFLGEY